MPITDIPDALEQCIDQFWAGNPALKRRALKEWYCTGRVSHHTNQMAQKAVDIWLSSCREASGEQP